MSKTTIPPNVRALVWARAAGYCQFENCPKRLDHDLVAGKSKVNSAYIAHIVADSENGPRGHPELSEKLKKDPSNLMLVCNAHHRIIDDPTRVDEYTVERLTAMKDAQEFMVTSAVSSGLGNSSLAVTVTAPIGANETGIAFEDCANAMRFFRKWPAELRPVSHAITGLRHNDAEDNYWQIELSRLRAFFKQQIEGRIESGEVKHLSVFALGPMPLLIEFGRLLSDITPAEVFQLHREPSPSWSWAQDGDRITFEETRLSGTPGVQTVALKIELSAHISDERVLAAMPDGIPIWSIRAENPNNDLMRYSGDLSEFRKRMRLIFDDIAKQYGPDVEIAIFPAVPVSCAVEIGRVWQPKAHPRLAIYDQSGRDGFVQRLIVAR